MENLRVHRSWSQAALASTLVLLAGSCSVFGSGSPPAAALKIGVDLPLSGAEGRAAAPALNGIRLYVRQHPTIGGFAVILVAKDDSVGGTPEPPLGAANVRSFADDPTVLGVIGPFDSSLARAEIPVANQAWLAMVSPATSSPCLTRDQYLPAALNPTRIPISCKDAGLPSAKELRPLGANNYFRLSTTDDLQGPAAADYAYNSLHLLRVATISDHEPYGQALAGSFVTRFRSLGGSIVGRLDLDPKASVDTLAFLKRMKADGAQAVYFGGTTANGGCAIRSEMDTVFGPGEAAPYLGGDGLAEDPACILAAGTAATGIFATVPGADATLLPSAAQFVAAFKAAYPNPAEYSPYSAIAFDATAVLYDALGRAIKAAGGGLPPRVGVISQLASTRAFAGATGTFGFDLAGDSTRRIISIFESQGLDPRASWKDVGTIDYTLALPY